ncbi:MAG TPA: TIGR00730 family Rossman fold protein [Arenicellales bacterium]|nr:TIGR00730 family Rossman fold protein [Arenicellales bacterium]
MKRICVFCGSRTGRKPAYVDAARSLASVLAQRRIGIVYGGAGVGIMGALADAALAEGGEVIGVIPENLMQRELSHRHLTELHVVSGMHERKALMGSLSDGFIALPGGLGTLEEFFEVLTWNQLGIHAKPCGLLNVDGFYDALASFLNHTVAEEFVPEAHRAFMPVDSEAAALVDEMQRRFAAMQSGSASVRA